MTGWSTDKKWREIGEYSHAAMEQDLEGEWFVSSMCRTRLLTNERATQV